MFGFRSDGKKLKKVDPILKLANYIMVHRHDSQVQMVKKVDCKSLDKYIKEQSKKDVQIKYMHLIIAAVVRAYALRPKLNRFIMGSRMYARKGIYISFVVKKSLKDTSNETTLKLKFTGKEDIFEIKEIVDKEISQNLGDSKVNNTDKLVAGFLKLPHFILRPVVGSVKLMDKFGILPKSIIDISPFHTSCFITNLKSISTDYVYHHLYDFGTTSLFIAMGKERMEPAINEDGKLVPAKIMKLGVVVDERICDGLYYAKSIKLLTKILQNPKALEEKLEKIEVDPDL